ncbi:hypothetical protein NQ314_019915 [Rhamnusium bicolor]|uniref:ISXO2-like transposase domain-containing protein n=1 Tax=Rhamnusium bicolor TaxID=1586634 RepID=A0AAV8WMV5_9CUCU|nr:hypothetical protein NQ314_019915 [Rhamnusium bicolor]
MMCFIPFPLINSRKSRKFNRLWAQSQTYIEHELQLSSSTVVDWSNFCREVCIGCIVDASECIGGPGIVVEIDEAKMGFERESKKCFFVPVENRTKDTLLEIIQKWILPGTTIMSDCWKSYDCLADEGFQHEAVNHSKNFVDPDTGAHTQNIERRWRDVRAGIPRFGRREQHFDGYLAEYQFRQVYPPAVSNFCEDSAGSD